MAVSTSVATAADPVGAPTKRSVRRKPWWRRRPVHKALVVTHRWTSLVLGLVLIAITTSGAAVLYEPEWQRWAHPEAYAVTPTTQPVSFDRAIDAVQTAHPDFAPGTVNVYAGALEVTSTDSEAHPGSYVVDPVTDEITGYVNSSHGVMGFFVNLHECALSCEGYTGYVPFLAKEIPPLAKILPGATGGTLVLAVMGVLLLFLAISGLVLWWPGIKRMSHGFRVRWRRSRYTRDFDLHQLVGFVAVPFLLMWGLTGASFELPLDSVWYAATGGVTPPEDQSDFASNEAKKGTPDISADAAVAAAATLSSGEPVYVGKPTEDGTAGYFQVWFSQGADPYKHGHYPGQVSVDVDRHDPTHLKQTYFAHAPTLSNQIWDVWRSGTLHYGYAVNGWWRLVWFGFGLVPLLLAWTGVSTWLYKLGVKRRRAKALAARVADPRLVDTT